METTLAQPRTTFLNLPPSKRESIVREAVAEFASQGYQGASINNIVKRLGIAKGSLYQYFDNKETLFLYVFDSFTHRVKDAVKESVAANGTSDFFDLVKQVLLAGIRFIDESPEYFQIYLKVLFEQDVPHREALVDRVRLFSREYFGPLCEAAQSQGVIRSDVSSQMVVFILDATMDRFLQDYARPHENFSASVWLPPDRMLAEIDTIIDVLRSGLAPQQKEM